MNSLALDIGMALWFGILTSISPCPLATNVTAISFIGRRVDRVNRVLMAGLLYTAGRMAAYIVLGVVLVAGIEYMPPVANFLQTYMIYLLGPVLIVIGLLLLDLFKISFPGGGVMWEGMQGTVERLGIWGALLMGVVFALSFCPVSAGLFFGSLFALAVKHQSMVILPSAYGIGTAIPVLVFAFVFAFAANAVGRLFDALNVFEKWARRVTGIIFILAGVYLIARSL